MFKTLLKGVLSAIAVKLLDDYRRLTMQLLKVEAVKCYVHGVRIARLSAVGLMRMGLLIGLICIGVTLLHAGLFILLPWSVEAKAILGLFLGLAYVATGAVALRATLAEKTWMEKSGATEMLEEALGRSKKE